MVPEATRELTYGEKAVGLTFNPSNDPAVQKIKVLYAQIIDELYQAAAVPRIESPIGALADSLYIEAVLSAVRAQMMAVKFVTFKV